MKQGQFEPQRKLVLYFDINKTIVLSDAKYNDLTKEECLQEILVGYAWGRLEQKDEKSPVQWKQTHPTFVASSPGEGMLSYKEYISSMFPLKTIEDEPNAARLKEFNESMIQKHIISHQRRGMYYQLLKQGGPGQKLKPEYDRLVKLITLPKSVTEELKIKMDEQIDQQSAQDIQKKNLTTLLQEKDNLSNLFSDGKYSIIPNFYKTIINLKKQKREFAIVFRPFGTDPKQIIREFNKFCTGDHPCFSGRNNTPIVRFDGSKGTKNYLILEKECGIFYRYGKDVSKTQLVMGTLRRGDNKKTLEDEYEKELDEESVQIQKNIGGIYLSVMEQLKESCGMCIQDDYQFYESSGEEDENNGKLLFIDQTDYDCLHIFFDDKIHENDQKNLVNVIDAITGDKISKKKALNKYLSRVDIVEAIKDPDYFLKIIDQCEKLRAEEIERIEKGIPEDIPDIIKKTEWELLQESTDSEYLRRTILPLLQPMKALKLVDLERPADPISFIALYCLKNKDRVKIPQPTQEFLDALNQKEEEQQKELKDLQEPKDLKEQPKQQEQKVVGKVQQGELKK